MPDAVLLTPNEVAEYLQISVKTLDAWRVHPHLSRRIPYVKIGSKIIRYRMSDIQEWVERNMVNKND